MIAGPDLNQAIAAALDAAARLAPTESITPPCQEERSALRSLAKASIITCPVKVIDGDAPPTAQGDSCHYTTRTGKPVYHPSAYAKKGWSSLVYHSSTICVEVGQLWLIRWRLGGGVFRPKNMANASKDT